MQINIDLQKMSLVAAEQISVKAEGTYKEGQGNPLI